MTTTMDDATLPPRESPSTSTIPVAPPASSGATASLVLGLIGLLWCQLLAPLAWWLGWRERRDIALGRSPASGQGLATAGMVLGIIGSVMLGFVLLAVLAIITVVIGLIVGGAIALH
jgi:hypothetical protein